MVACVYMYISKPCMGDIAIPHLKRGTMTCEVKIGYSRIEMIGKQGRIHGYPSRVRVSRGHN